MIAPSDTPNETYVVESPLHIASNVVFNEVVGATTPANMSFSDFDLLKL